MPTRRDFLKLSALVAGSTLVPWQRLYAAIAGGTLPPSQIPKFAEPLVIPPAMPPRAVSAKAVNYNIAVQQFRQQILPTGLPQTTVWSYCVPGRRATLNYPAFTIEARYNVPAQVTWINGLVDSAGNYLPHILPVDPTLHWANPGGGLAGRDTRPPVGLYDPTPSRYTGPVPLVTHVHGIHTHQESDGYPEAWYLPNATNIPAGYARTGTFYDAFKLTSPYGAGWKPGTAVFRYPNDQPASTLWYHDHALGMTRTNVYAGPAGFYIIRGGPHDLPAGYLPGPAPGVNANPSDAFFEIPIAIQDRSFNTDGSLFYPDTREFFDGIADYMPLTDISPIWNPEFFGNAMVVNGRTWPYLNVQRRRYRFRVLNGCNSRFLILKFSNGMRFWQIGAEGGFLPQAVELERLLLAPAERADVIVDFTNVTSEVVLENIGPDEPFGGGEPDDDFDAADPGSTGLVMKFIPAGSAVVDSTVHPMDLPLAEYAPPQPSGGSSRQLSLNEMMSMSPGLDGPAAALLGSVHQHMGEYSGHGMMWADEVTENIDLNSTEVWELHNFTEDAHPIHLHQVQFQVVNRQTGSDVRGPEPWEYGLKDTVIAYPGEITRIRARFDIPGRFVWHCHIVEHEDNEMMRPFLVL